MPRLSKKSGKQTEKQIKNIEFNIKENFEYFESKYHFLESLKSKIKAAVSGISDEKIKITVLLRTKEELERRFLNPDINIVPWMRTESNIISNSHTAEDIHDYSSRYLNEFEGQIDHFTTDLSKRNLQSIIERYQSIMPYEMQFIIQGKGSDKKNPRFVAYVFQTCHYYFQYLQSLIDQTSIKDNGQLLEEIMEKLSLNIGAKISAQSIMILLKETNLLDCLILHMNPSGQQKFYKLMSILLGKSESTIRKIREDMIGTSKKNDPYNNEDNIIEAAKLLKNIGYPDLADNLLSKYHLI